jgi:hypothetical protein
MMEYRGIEYNVVQGLGRHLWKWFVTTGRVELTGHGHDRAEAVCQAERAVDRILAVARLGRERVE